MAALPAPAAAVDPNFANAPCPAMAPVGQAAAPQPLRVTGDRILEVNLRELHNALQEEVVAESDITTMDAARELAAARKPPGTRIFDDDGSCSNNNGIVDDA